MACTALNGKCPSMTGCLAPDVNHALTVALPHSAGPRTPGFLINYGLPPRIAQALIRGGWSTVAELDSAEQAWLATQADTFDAWLNSPEFGVVGGRGLRQALERYRDREPVMPPQNNAVTRLTATIIAQVAAGEFERGHPLPGLAAFARSHGVQPTVVSKAYDVLALAGWCAWRNRPDAGDSRHRQHPVALTPGQPYDLMWSSTVTTRARRRATAAAEFLRHNPGAWRSQDTTNTVQKLRRIADADFDDVAGTLTVVEVSR